MAFFPFQLYLALHLGFQEGPELPMHPVFDCCSLTSFTITRNFQTAHRISRGHIQQLCWKRVGVPCSCQWFLVLWEGFNAPEPKHPTPAKHRFYHQLIPLFSWIKVLSNARKIFQCRNLQDILPTQRESCSFTEKKLMNSNVSFNCILFHKTEELFNSSASVFSSSL